MSKRASDANGNDGLTGFIGSLLANLTASLSSLALILLKPIAPGLTSSRARYERRHRRLAGPRPGARLH